MTDVTRILNQIEQGDPSAADQLLPIVYEDLRRLAAVKLANENPGQTLQATALLHEAYVRLVDVDVPQHWNGRKHFFAAAAEAMRRILVEKARQKNRVRHGGEYAKVTLENIDGILPSTSDEILAVHDLVDALETKNPAAAEVVKLRYFAGMTIPEAAEALTISPRKVDKLWSYARAWLLAEIGSD